MLCIQLNDSLYNCIYSVNPLWIKLHIKLFILFVYNRHYGTTIFTGTDVVTMETTAPTTEASTGGMTVIIIAVAVVIVVLVVIVAIVIFVALWRKKMKKKLVLTIGFGK